MTPLVAELIPAPDPLAACAAFLGAPHLCFLDSAALDPRQGRYTFLAADPVTVLTAPGSSDPLGDARDLLHRHRAAAIPGLPPFQGGWMGYWGYDWGAARDGVVAPGPDTSIPDVALGFYDWVIAWDLVERRAWVIATGTGQEGRGGSEARARQRVAEVRARLRAVDRHTLPPAPAHPPVLSSNFTRPAYLSLVARIREYIAAGDIFQANLSQCFSAGLAEAPFDLYRRLRTRTPAPFAAFLDYGDVVLASASPERFLRVDTAGHVETRPIKGTRPRGGSPASDAALAQALAASEKDRAENIMIVDVLRNDLGRVCRFDSVAVPELCAVESHPTVHHLVSTVVGELAAGRDALDLLAAAFPGGSITGAPKIRAMQIIAELEARRRGPYCGAIGYLSVTGAMDTSVAIRTFVASQGSVSFHVGGGITADSEPAAEYQETLDKGAALCDALTGAVTDPAPGRD